MPIGLYLRDADPVAVEFAIGTGATLIAVDGPLESHLAGVIELAGRRALVGSELGACHVVTSFDDAAAPAGAAGTVLLDLRAAMDRLLAGEEAAAFPTPFDLGLGRPPLVLLSGMLGDASLWDRVAGRLADVVVPVPLRIDLDDTITEMAASVLAAAPPSFVLAGHSLGGIVALEILRQAADRVRGVALVATSARGPSDVQIEAWRNAGERTRAGGFDDVAADLARATLGENARADARLVEHNLRMSRAVGGEGFLRQLAAQASRPESRPHLADVDVPALVVSGELDTICPPDLQRELAAGLSTSSLVEIAGSGHMVPIEKPDELAEQLRRWLTDAVLGADESAQLVQ